VLAARSGIAQLVQLASTLAIAHFLLPEAYGTLAVALTTLGFARYVGDFGLTLSLIALPRLDGDTLRGSATFALGFAVAEASGLVLLASPLAQLLDGPSYSAEIIRVLGLCLVVETLRFGPIIRINRDLAFSRLGMLQLSDMGILYASQISLLLAGAGVWSLVVSQIARSVLGTAVYVWRGGGVALPKLRCARLALVRRAFPYQGPAILAGLGGFLTPIVLATVMNAGQIGFWAWSTVLVTPLSALVTIMSSIMLPSLARLRRTDAAAVDRAAALVLRASLLLPAAGAGLLLGFSHPIVSLIFGDRWKPALTAVEINLLGIIPSTLSFFLAAILESAQRARERFLAYLGAQIVGLPLLFVLASAAGVPGAAFVSGIAVPLVDIVALAWLAKISIVNATARATFALAAAAAIAWVLARTVHTVFELGLAGVGSLVPVLFLVWLSDREAVRTVIRWGVPVPDWLARRGVGQ
jgi:PST family polysaccharide transporter